MKKKAAKTAKAARVRRLRPAIAQGTRIARIADILGLSVRERARVIAAMTPLECAQLFHDWNFWARPDQAPPPGDWVIWLILAGRGAGKTRAGAEAVRHWTQDYPIVNLIGPTANDVRDTIVLGESGILTCCRRDEMPRCLDAASRIEWPNGAVSLLFSAEEPDRLRGKQHMKLWCDELAAWRQPETFDQALLGLRLGDKPQAIVTTTPRPTRIIKTLASDKDTIVTRGSTFDNKGNLARAFLEKFAERYQGRTIGRQELFAEIVEETPGALWTRALLERQRVAPEDAPREFAEVVVAVDPPARSVAARAEGALFYVLADLTSQGESPGQWGRAGHGRLSRLQGRPGGGGGQQRRRHGGVGVPPPECIHGSFLATEKSEALADALTTSVCANDHSGDSLHVPGTYDSVASGAAAKNTPPLR
jgi:phage terminase large subunit-like protein